MIQNNYLDLFGIIPKDKLRNKLLTITGFVNQKRGCKDRMEKNHPDLTAPFLIQEYIITIQLFTKICTLDSFIS